MRTLLEDRPTAITAVNLGEALDIVSRRSGARSPAVARTVGALTRRGLTLGSDSPELAERAATIRSVRCHRRDRPISLADCFAIAAARGATLATADRDQAAVAREEGVEVIDLPPYATR